VEYLTALEIANKWNISSRMVAYYCENGRINGAVKKGKKWIIPVNSEKPVDKRYSKKKINIKENSELQGERQNINKTDIENITAIYRTSDIYKNLGLTREILRYYEEIGLINPKRNQDNQYREFDFFDISHLMAIDFYKKRGFRPLEIKELMKASKPEDYFVAMKQQIETIERNIQSLQDILSRLKATQKFCTYNVKHISEFMIKNLPLYSVQESMDAVSSFREYQDKVLTYLHLENEDILSNMVRTIAFDETGYKGSEMCIVKSATKKSEKHTAFLEDGKCLYTTIAADNDDNSIMDKMFSLAYKWAAEHKEAFRGVVYIFIRFIMLNDHKRNEFI
jgi:DNA-binding transcriptional MerR regulator